MAKLDLKTFFMKMVNVFPKDMYIVHNWCVVAGEESDSITRGFYFCILDADARELLNNTFSNSQLLYIKSIRDAKTDISDIQEIGDDNRIKEFEKTIENFMNDFNKINTWNTFNFSEDELSSLYGNGDSLTLFENNENISPLIISKSVFPLITEKTINNVNYSCGRYQGNSELNYIMMDYKYDFFQLIMRYFYLDI